MNDYEVKSQNILKIEIMWLINREKESLKKSEITNLEGRMISLPPPLLNNIALNRLFLWQATSHIHRLKLF